MTSCGGTSRTTVLSEIRTIVSKGQKMSVSPGPFGLGDRRPSQKVTARSYSFRTLIHFERKTSATNTTGTRSDRFDGIEISLCPFRGGANEDVQTVETHDLDVLAGGDVLR